MAAKRVVWAAEGGRAPVVVVVVEAVSVESVSVLRVRVRQGFDAR